MVLARGLVGPLVVATLIATLIGACAPEDDAYGETLQNEEAVRSIKNLTTFSNDACKPIPSLPSDFLGALPGCCGSKGKCIPNGPTLGSQGDQLPACKEGGKCVPTDLLTLAKKPLRTCKSLGDGDGVCFPTCVDAVDRLKLILPQADCDDGERCVPCISPTDKKPTGLCELGKTPVPKSCPKADEKPTPEQCQAAKRIVDVSKLKPCPAGHCVLKSVAGGDADQLEPCSDPAYLCAPDDFIATGGLYTPPTCTSIGGAEGRCLNANLKQVKAQADRLPKEGCKETERCAPCFDPVSGKELPSCNTGCDTGPKKPPFTFAHCKADLGRCVPQALVGTSGLVNLALKKDTCAEGEICAPLAAVEPEAIPRACTTTGKLSGTETGVCLENVFSGLVNVLGGVVGLVQADCQSDFLCVPCSIGKDAFKGCSATP